MRDRDGVSIGLLGGVRTEDAAVAAQHVQAEGRAACRVPVADRNGDGCIGKTLLVSSRLVVLANQALKRL